MTTIDYSKNDFIDINNRLFRQARKNIGENNVAIKDLDDGLQQGQTENLLYYGSELINNLKQINYTFDQLEQYIFVPSKVNKKNIKRVIEAGVKALVEDIKADTLPIEELVPDELVPPKTARDIVIERYVNFDAPKADEIYSKTELEEFRVKCDEEMKNIRKIIMALTKEVGVIGAKDDEIIKELKFYIDYLKMQYALIEKRLEEEPEGEGVEETKEPEEVLGEEKSSELPIEGAGRMRGGVGKKKGEPKAPKTPKTPKAKKAKEPVIEAPEDPDEFVDLIDDAVVASETKEGLGDAEELDKSLVNAVNAGQKSPVPSYLTKIYELMMNLVQFIGKTNVLFITRIKKNINYLDEEQIKLIFEQIRQFKDKLQMLKNFKNKGGALIKDTLYTQVEKETLDLYNEINNSVRNYKKLKDFTIFSGAGLRGGYFIQSDSPFIKGSTTKRFL